MILVALHCPACQRPHVATCPARDTCPYCAHEGLTVSVIIEDERTGRT